MEEFAAAIDQCANEIAAKAAPKVPGAAVMRAKLNLDKPGRPVEEAEESLPSAKPPAGIGADLKGKMIAGAIGAAIALIAAGVFGLGTLLNLSSERDRERDQASVERTRVLATAQERDELSGKLKEAQHKAEESVAAAKKTRDERAETEKKLDAAHRDLDAKDVEIKKAADKAKTAAESLEKHKKSMGDLKGVVRIRNRTDQPVKFQIRWLDATRGDWTAAEERTLNGLTGRYFFMPGGIAVKLKLLKGEGSAVNYDVPVTLIATDSKIEQNDARIRVMSLRLNDKKELELAAE
jgi:chromosome segregation ATPase